MLATWGSLSSLLSRLRLLATSPFNDGSSVIHRELCFFSDPLHEQVPYYRQDSSERPGHRNYEHNRVVVPIREIGSSTETFELKTHSFAAIPRGYITAHKDDLDFNSEAAVWSTYVPEMKRLLLNKVPGAQEIIVYDAVVRRASNIKTGNRQVNKLHVDQSPKGAYSRAGRHLSPKDYADVIAGKRRLRIINVWKPTVGPVRDHPLVFADHRSIEQDDLVPVTQAYPDYTGETYGVRHRPGQEFWYWSGMQVEDIILLQCFDSQVNAPSTGGTRNSQCVHGSFHLRDDGYEPCDRQSIELRCLVLG